MTDKKQLQTVEKQDMHQPPFQTCNVVNKREILRAPYSFPLKQKLGFMFEN